MAGMTEYAGGFRGGDPVAVLHIIGAGVPPNLLDRTGVVANMTDSILAVIQEGEVPVRFATVLSARLHTEETVVYLLPPEWIRHVGIAGVIHGTSPYRQRNK
jgi:hypothetical protein